MEKEKDNTRRKNEDFPDFLEKKTGTETRDETERKRLTEGEQLGLVREKFLEVEWRR